MATHAALAASRIPTSARLHSRAASRQRVDFADFSGLRPGSCSVSTAAREASFSDVLGAQLVAKATGENAVRAPAEAKLKVAINGFGRIGRNFLRCWHGREDSPLEVVVVNDSGGVRNASHLLKYDSMLGTFKAYVKIVDDTTISVDGKPIKVVSSRDPLKLPWAEMGIDIVIEGTGVFVDGPGAGKHIQAGAKKVIITAPAKGADIPTYVVGVNEGDYDHGVADIISNASCTTNCLAPFVKILDEEFGIVKGTMTTTHSYTGDQRLLDASHRDLRRARAAALNIVPTSTGAAKAVALVLPQLKGKLNGIALRVPTPNVSVVDLVVNTEKKGMTADDINAAFRKAAAGPLKGVLGVCDEPLVSVDFRCSDVSSSVDSSLTMVMGDDMVKVVAWYDNEWGYSQRVVDLAHLVAAKWPGAAAAGGSDPLEDFCKDNPATKECKGLDLGTLSLISPTDVRPGFLPVFRSGSCAEIGPKSYMEDEHVCVDNLIEHLGGRAAGIPAPGAFYGVFDGHGGTDAACFVRKNILKFIVEDAHFPSNIEKAIRGAFLKADHALADSHSLDNDSGTTALTALLFGRTLFVANAGDCRAVLGKRGRAVELSRDHKPNCKSEKIRIEKLGGTVFDGYLNGQLAVARALGDWHMKGPKGSVSPLSAEPELQEIVLSEEDEFLIIGCDGLWDVMTSQCAVTIVRKELMQHNDPERCSSELVQEALKRDSCDNLTVVVICFSSNPPPQIEIPRSRVRRSISLEGLHLLRGALDSNA